MNQGLVIGVFVLPVEIQSPIIILNLIFISGGPLCNQTVLFPTEEIGGIESNVGCKSHAECFRKFAEFIDIFQKRGQVSGLPF